MSGRLHDAARTWQRTPTASLEDAGFEALECSVVAEVAIAVWQGSITRWFDDDASLADHLQASFAALTPRS